MPATGLLGSVLVLFFSLLNFGCSSANSGSSPHSDYSIDTYSPSPNEIARAEERARRYWLRNAARFGDDPHYLAVDTTKLLEGEIVQNLWPKLINSAHSTAFFAGSLEEYPQVNIYCVMIFNTRTGKFVSNQGYAVVDFPPKGSVARFGDYIARFIGSG